MLFLLRTVYSAALNRHSPLQVTDISLNLSHLSFSLCSMCVPPTVPIAPGDLTSQLSFPRPFFFYISTLRMFFGNQSLLLKGTDSFQCMYWVRCTYFKLGCCNIPQPGLGTSVLCLAHYSPGMAVNREWSVLQDRLPRNEIVDAAAKGATLL